ncbi:DUF4234 domain-containing protein [Candidatus Blastococcus massiliensis]|uniref:DUF4234 domain-containing protein n=1 Tax=Candidatus Blastococcus massiliensis TaxID=1470358 RepID=UPI0004B2C96F|nr:DUF4234 domain-containing protein [Candidatus Blastococcus massiliensis]
MSTPEHESTTPTPTTQFPAPAPPPPSPDAGQGAEQPQPYGAPPPPPPGYGQAMPAPPAWSQYAAPSGALGKRRPTGMTILLFLITFGIWGLIYYFQTHEEMKRHTGEGLGGIVALVIAVVFGLVSPFLLSNEVGKLYERRGQAPPVSALTGLWVFPGIFILVGPFIWFVKTNNALNSYWESQGVTQTSLI